MKRFESLEFKQHPCGDGKQARLDFKNGYGVSVLLGDKFYSNGTDTYELAVMENGNIAYNTPITDDVLVHLTSDEVSEFMLRVQEL